MAEIPIDDGVYADDVVELEGHPFVVTGNIQGQNISEFSTGIKIGAATYDEREHAFWTVFDDFSGGMGYREANLREAGGTHYDNPGGIDLRRPRHITLPAQRASVDPSADPSTASPPLFFRQKTMLVSDISGADFLYIGMMGAIFRLNASRTTLSKVADLSQMKKLMRLIEFRGSDGVRALYAFGFSTTLGSGTYFRSTNGTTWTAGDRPLVEGIVWDAKIIASKEANTGELISSADGTTWDEDDALIGVHWKPGFWVIFVGIAPAPWGDNAVYFIDEGVLWALDWDFYHAVPIEEVGDQLYLTEGVVWNGSIFVTDAHNVWSYNPASGETVRHLGPFGKENPPPESWWEQGWHIVQFLTGTSTLFAICRNSTCDRTRLLVYTGTGWTWYGEEIALDDGMGGIEAQCVYSALIDRFPLNWELTTPSRAIDAIVGQQAATTEVRLYTWRLPLVSDAPYRGSGTLFAEGPLFFTTGWYGGGFDELTGALFRVNVDGYSITEDENILVEYRLDNDEDANFHELGTFTHNKQEFWFDEDRKGLEFKTVQFRVTLTRATANTTKSPELKSLVLVFDKRPNLRSSWGFRIDLKRSVEKFDSYQNVRQAWETLKSVYNTKTLVAFEAGKVEGILNVRIAQMTPTFSEIRLDDTSAGFVDVQVLEPVVEEA